MIGKCLAKDAAQRYQNTADIIVDLSNLAEKLKSGRSTILRTAVGARDEVGTGNPAGPSPRSGDGQAESLTLPRASDVELSPAQSGCPRMEAAPSMGVVRCRHYRFSWRSRASTSSKPFPKRRCADFAFTPESALRDTRRACRDLSQWQAHCLRCRRGGKQALDPRSRSWRSREGWMAPRAQCARSGRPTASSSVLPRIGSSRRFPLREGRRSLSARCPEVTCLEAGGAPRATSSPLAREGPQGSMRSPARGGRAQASCSSWKLASPARIFLPLQAAASGIIFDVGNPK